MLPLLPVWPCLNSCVSVSVSAVSKNNVFMPSSFCQSPTGNSDSEPGKGDFTSSSIFSWNASSYNLEHICVYWISFTRIWSLGNVLWAYCCVIGPVKKKNHIFISIAKWHFCNKHSFNSCDHTQLTRHTGKLLLGFYSYGIVCVFNIVIQQNSLEHYSVLWLRLGLNVIHTPLPCVSNVLNSNSYCCKQTCLTVKRETCSSFKSV